MKNENITPKTRIGITGSTGVLGSRLMEILLSTDADLTCLVRESSNMPYNQTKVKLIYGDLNDKKAIESFISQVDICIHLAAQVSFAPKNQYHKINVEGTENLCKAIVAVNPNCRLVNCSSVAAYRMNGFFKAQYTHYAKSKRKADEIVEKYQQHHGLKAAVVIPGLIYGPGKNKFIPTVLDYLKGDNVYLVKGGEHNAPLTYIDDLCDLLIKAAMSKHADGQRYFAFSTSDTGIHDFIQMIAAKSSIKLPPLRKFSKSLLMLRAIISEYLFTLFNITGTPKYTKRMVDILSINFELNDDIRNNNLNWSAKVDPQTGLDNCFKWYENQK
jgi:nucleoside-diphosphate-sugar epimerase